MSRAKEDFLQTLESLEKISSNLGAAELGSQVSRSVNNIKLNGAHVIAFAALEDFLRRRSLEVIAWLGNSGAKFEQFPESLRRFILEETIKGLNFSISKIEDDDRITVLQLQGILLETTSNEKLKFEPSEYFFGKSQSNISKKQIGELLSALDLDGGLGCLDDIASLAKMSHLGAPAQIFARLAKNRHKAAHGFGVDYKVQEFITDVRSGLPLVAFAFDTAISQRALDIAEKIRLSHPVSAFLTSKIVLRHFEFNKLTSKWQEFRGDRKIKDLAKGGLDVRLKDFKSGTAGRGETVIIRGATGGIENWFQPNF